MTERFTDAADLAARKDEHRRRLRTLRSALPRAVVDERSSQAAQQLATLPLDGVTTIALYAGSEQHGELDPRSAAASLRQRGLLPVYPRVAQQDLVFHAADEDELVPAPFGLYEPSSDAPQVELSSIDAFVVPGLGFSVQGDRLGFGGGYYDRTLSRAPRALRIGYAHPEQIVSDLPTASYDERVDYLITPSHVLRCPPRFSAPVPGANP